MDSVLGCQVVNCKEEAAYRCSAGYRYCKTHKKPHGEPGEAHTFRTISPLERNRGVKQPRQKKVAVTPS